MDEQQVPYTHAPNEPYNWVRVRMIGGKSNFWARMSFRLSDYEFKGKDFDGYGENWPISHAELAPYYSRVEPIFRVTGRKEGLAQLPDGEFVPDNRPIAKPPNKLRVARQADGDDDHQDPPRAWATASSPARSTCCCRMRWRPAS